MEDCLSYLSVFLPPLVGKDDDTQPFFEVPCPHCVKVF